MLKRHYGHTEVFRMAEEIIRLKALNAELLKVMVQACEDLTGIVWTDEALGVRDRIQETITATDRKP